MSHRFSKNELSIIKDRGILFDANILIYLFVSTGSQSLENTYSSLYNSLLRLNATYYVNFIIISEVVNRAIKNDYKNYLWKTIQEEEDFPFKKFRNCIDGQEALTDIYQIIESDILNRFQVAGKAINKAEIMAFLKVDNLDFSDKAIELICKENDFVLLTHDGDFRDSNIDILSLNNDIINN